MPNVDRLKREFLDEIQRRMLRLAQRFADEIMNEVMDIAERKAEAEGMTKMELLDLLKDDLEQLTRNSHPYVIH